MSIPHPRLYQSNENANLNKIADASLNALLTVKKTQAHNILPTFANLTTLASQNVPVFSNERKAELGIHFNENDMLGFHKETTIARFFSHENGVIVEITPCLNEMMENTDVQNIPANLINLPFDLMYFHITKKPVINNMTSPIAGIYISKFKELVTDINYESYKKTNPSVNTGESISVISLVYVFDGYGKPFEKRTLVSSNSYLRDEDTVDFVDSVTDYIVSNANPLNKAYLKEFSTLSTELVLKTILYMNTKGMRSVAINELSDFKKKYLSFGKKRAEKQANKFPSKYDRIIIGPESIHASAGVSHGSETKATHWRRGHFRNQACGEGLKDRQIIWIQPTIINAIENEIPTPKTYKVKP